MGLADIFAAVAKVRVRLKLHRCWKIDNTRAILLNRLSLQSQQQSPLLASLFQIPTDCFLFPFSFPFRILMFFPIITHQVGVEML